MLYMVFKVLSQNNKERSNIQIQLVLKLHINVIKRFSDTAEVLAHFLEITGNLNLNECVRLSTMLEKNLKKRQKPPTDFRSL